MTFDKWFEENGDEIAQSREFALSDRAYEPANVDADVRRSRREYVRMGTLLSQMETFTVQARMAAIRRVHKDEPDLSAQESKVFVDADETYRGYCEIRDDLQQIVSALSKMHFELMNFRSNALKTAVSGD